MIMVSHEAGGKPLASKKPDQDSAEFDVGPIVDRLFAKTIHAPASVQRAAQRIAAASRDGSSPTADDLGLVLLFLLEVDPGSVRRVARRGFLGRPRVSSDSPTKKED
jgi:hypothetical protein